MVSIHMKNVQIEGCACPMREYEDRVVEDSELEANMKIK
jgi:hypothetical protein